MKSTFNRNSILAAAMAAVLLLVGSSSAFSQGKGHGRGNGNGRGGGQGQEWRGDRGDKGGDRGRGNSWKQEARQQQQQQQVMRVHQDRQNQQRQADWNARRQQQANEWNVRRQQDQQRQAERNARRQQQANEWNVRQQQRQQAEWNARRQEQANDRNIREQQRRQEAWQQQARQQQWQRRSDDAEKAWKRDRRDAREQWKVLRDVAKQNEKAARWRQDQAPVAQAPYRRARQNYGTVYNAPVQIVPGSAYDGGWGKGGGLGQFDKRTREVLKARKKLWQQQQRSDRYASAGYYDFYRSNSNYYPDRQYYEAPYTQSRSYRVYQQPSYDQGYYSYDPSPAYYGGDPYYYGPNDGIDWKHQLISLVINNFLGSGFGGSGYVTEPDGYYANTPFYQAPRYSANNYGGGFYPVGVSQPYGYADYGGGYDGYNNYPEFGYDGGGNFGDILASLPIAELIQGFTGGDSFIGDLVGGLLSQGYDEGYYAGETARDLGYEEVQFYDPYAVNGAGYSPYSLCSSSMAANRQLMSNAYEMGYRDAMERRRQYDPLHQGEPDLVSMLLGGFLSNV